MSESSFGPIGQPLRARPAAVPRAAPAPAGIVGVDLPRPLGGAFQLRILDEFFRPSEADVVALHVFYGIDVDRLAGGFPP